MLHKLRWARFGFAALMAMGLSIACARSQSNAPTTPEASPLAIEATPDNTLVKAGASQTIVAKIDLSAVKRSTALRPPVNVALVIDTSGSMEGRAIEDARKASLAMLDALAPDDRLAVIAFHSKAEVLLSSTRIKDADMKELRKKISAMKAQGTTDMQSGLQLGLAEVSRDLVKDGVNRIVLCGDGVPNLDDFISTPIAEARAKGISITTLGLGNDYDETLMGRIAQQTGGKFAYIDDSAKVGSFFKEEVTRLHRVVARNAVVELHPGPGIHVKSVIGRPMMPLPNKGVQVPIGDIALGEKQELVVELAANAAKDGAVVEAVDAVIRWQDAVGAAEMHEERVFVGLKATNDDARIAQGKNTGVADALARAKDAAATLEKIEQQRRDENARQRNQMGNAPSPVSPHSQNERMKPKMPVGGGAAVPTPSPMAPEEMRRAHDSAIQNFQAHY